MWQIACRHCRRSGRAEAGGQGPGGSGVETTAAVALAGRRRRL